MSGKPCCKLCCEPVSKRNGIQCLGACRRWAHYKCLDFTPGKIQDIKAGVIEVLCPCPDCSTTQPKEVLLKPPYICTNSGCPANVGKSGGSFTSLPKSASTPSQSCMRTGTESLGSMMGGGTHASCRRGKKGKDTTCCTAEVTPTSSILTASSCSEPQSVNVVSSSESRLSKKTFEPMAETLQEMRDTMETLTDQMKAIMTKLTDCTH